MLTPLRNATTIARRLAAAGILTPRPAPRPYASGADNHVFTATNSEGGLVVIKTPRQGRTSRYTQAAWASRVVRLRGVPAPQVLAHTTDYLVESFSDGRTLSLPRDGHEDRPSALSAAEDAGRLLATIHTIAAPGFGRLQTNGSAAHATWGDWLATTPSGRAHAPNLATRADAAVREYATSLEPVAAHLVHGDFTARHVLAQQGRVAALVDWESVRGGHPLADVAGWSLQEPAALTEALLSGYFGPSTPQPAQLLAATLCRVRIALSLLAYHVGCGDTAQASFRARQAARDLEDLDRGQLRLIPAHTHPEHQGAHAS